MTYAKPNFPIGASKWWQNPVKELSVEQLASKRQYGRQYRAFKRATDPNFKELDRLAHQRCINKDRPRCYARNAAWRKKNWAKVLQSRRRLQYRIPSVMRSRICKALKSQKAIKSSNLSGLLGCTLLELRKHLERQFRPGMSWANYGPVWHVDHKRPCSSFDLSNPGQQKLCFGFGNLQPLFARDNLTKSSRT